MTRPHFIIDRLIWDYWPTDRFQFVALCRKGRMVSGPKQSGWQREKLGLVGDSYSIELWMVIFP